MDENINEMIEKLREGSGKSNEEIQTLLKQKMDKYSGLLTETAAAYMVAKGLGIALHNETEKGKTLEKAEPEMRKISELSNGLDNISLEVVVKQIFTPRQFEKAGKKGTLCNLLVADDTGEIRLTLWHADVKKIQDAKIEKGATVLLKSCYVTSYTDKLQLNLSRAGEIILGYSPKSALPSVEKNFLKLNELKDGLQDVDTAGRISRIYDMKSFAKEGRQGNLISFQLVDGTGNVRCTAWNELSAELSKFSQGDLIKIESAYTKQGLNGIELQLGWKARIIKDPKGIEIPTLNELLGRAVERKEINQIVGSENLVEIQGEIMELGKGNLYYNVCQKCQKKLERLDEGFACSNCGEVKEPDIRPILGLEVADSTAQCRVVLFGSQAEKLLGFDKEALKRKLDKQHSEDILAEISNRLKGKAIKVQGRAKENNFSGGIEIMVDYAELASKEKIAESKVV